MQCIIWKHKRNVYHKLNSDHVLCVHAVHVDFDGKDVKALGMSPRQSFSKGWTQVTTHVYK